MLHIVHFQDNPNADPNLRAQFMAQHLAFLSSNKNRIRAAGPLKDEDGQVRSGLWIVDVNSLEQAWNLVKADPFWPTGLRDKIDIKEWVQVFANGETLV